MILPADGTDFPFFGGGEPGCFHCFDCSFVSGVKWRTHVSSTVTIRLRNALDSADIGVDSCVTLLLFWPSENRSKVLGPTLLKPLSYLNECG